MSCELNIAQSCFDCLGEHGGICPVSKRAVNNGEAMRVDEACDFCHGFTGRHDFMFKSAFGMLHICSNCVERMAEQLEQIRSYDHIVEVEALDLGRR